MTYVIGFGIAALTFIVIALLLEALRRRFGFDPVNKAAEILSQRDAMGQPLATNTPTEA